MAHRRGRRQVHRRRSRLACNSGSDAGPAAASTPLGRYNGRQSTQREGFMDSTTDYLSDYACRLTYGDLSPEAVHQVKRTLVDTLGCGVGAFDAEPASIARRAASRVRGNPPARILGTPQQTS